MKNVFYHDSPRGEGFLIVVNCDDLDHNIMKSEGEHKESMNMEHGGANSFLKSSLRGSMQKSSKYLGDDLSASNHFS
jgi:hypothetical protein